MSSMDRAIMAELFPSENGQPICFYQNRLRCRDAESMFRRKQELLREVYHYLVKTRFPKNHRRTAGCRYGEKAQRDATMLRLAGESSVKTHFSARAKIQAVMYLTLSPPVLKMLPTMHPIMLTRNILPVRRIKGHSEGENNFRKRQFEAVEKGQYSAAKLNNRDSANVCRPSLFR